MCFTNRRSFAASSTLAVVLALLSYKPAFAVTSPTVELASEPGARLGFIEARQRDARWSVRGRLRLLPDPLVRSDPGQVVLELVAPDGRIRSERQAVVYRVVTANRRARIFGFHGTLPDDLPKGTVLRVRHLPAARSRS